MSIVLSELHFPFYNILKEKARISTTRMLSQHQLTAAWLHSVLPGWNAGLEKNFKLTTIYLGISLNIVLHPLLPFHFVNQELAILLDFFYRKQSKRYREFMWPWAVHRTCHSTCLVHVLCGSLLSFIHLLLRAWWPKLIHSRLWSEHCHAQWHDPLPGGKPQIKPMSKIVIKVLSFLK